TGRRRRAFPARRAVAYCPKRTAPRQTRDGATGETAMSGCCRSSHRLLALAVLAALSGCMQSRVDESRELHTQIARSEAVVSLPKPQLEGAQADEGFMDCVGGELAGRGDSAIAVRAHQEFLDSTFPWFEPGTAPSRPEAVEQVLTRPGVAE